MIVNALAKKLLIPNDDPVKSVGNTSAFTKYTKLRPVKSPTLNVNSNHGTKTSVSTHIKLTAPITAAIYESEKDLTIPNR